jgi:hypothetical protein
MRNSFLSPLKNKLTLATAVAVVGITCLWAEDVKKDGSALSFKVHPQVFSMIQGWNSDTESPVATEISLDAVEKNRNQFSNDEIKQEDGWTICREADAKGFKRYRMIEKKVNHYKVEYQENGGGTLTTSSTIEFSVATREIEKNGKPTTIRVLRVEACTTK